MMNLDFLKNVQLEGISKKTSAPKATIVKLPEDADIRVFSNGKVYPSKKFADLYSLEFVKKQVVVEGSDPEVTGNGVDIFASNRWPMISGSMPEGVVVLFGCVVPKTYPKVDMWANTKYDDETGEPKASVFTQGVNNFSKSLLLGMLEEAHNINWEITEYVDLSFDTTIPMVSPNKMYDIPKVVSGGAKKGQWTTIRRQNIDVYPLVVKATKTNGIPSEPVQTPVMESKAVEHGAPFDEDLNAKEVEVVDPITFDAPAVDTSTEDIGEIPAPEVTLSSPVIPPPPPQTAQPTPPASSGVDWAATLGSVPVPKPRD